MLEDFVGSVTKSAFQGGGRWHARVHYVGQLGPNKVVLTSVSFWFLIHPNVLVPLFSLVSS